ncbi:hypothetical protein [Streptomyces sp. NPDC006739]|uniref:hypothetical protein n=1 Tax=Streptomyces sp. NPDC006739 TaxID=3364763 RepID=UPI00368D9AAE
MNLRDSAYGGTIAMVWLPQEVLADVETPRDVPARTLPEREATRTPAPEEPRSTPVADAPALPTRVRQASLAAGLRESPPSRDAGPGGEADAEEMRAVFGAFQRGLERGRKGLPRTTHADEGTGADDAR